MDLTTIKDLKASHRDKFKVFTDLGLTAKRCKIGVDDGVKFCRCQSKSLLQSLNYVIF